MSATHHKPKVAVIVGLGATGLSCARYLLDRGWRVCVTDSRADPPGRAQLAMLDPDITVRLGILDTSLLDEAVCVVASPGVPLSDPFFAEARRRAVVTSITRVARSCRRNPSDSVQQPAPKRSCCA